LKDLSVAAVEGGIVTCKINFQNTIEMRIPFGMSHKDGLVLPGLWDIIPTFESREMALVFTTLDKMKL
jgi:hypothetical protein